MRVQRIARGAFQQAGRRRLPDYVEALAAVRSVAGYRPGCGDRTTLLAILAAARQQRRLPDAGLAAEQNQRSGDNAAAGTRSNS